MVGLDWAEADVAARPSSAAAADAMTVRFMMTSSGIHQSVGRAPPNRVRVWADSGLRVFHQAGSVDSARAARPADRRAAGDPRARPDARTRAHRAAGGGDRQAGRD